MRNTTKILIGIFMFGVLTLLLSESGFGTPTTQNLFKSDVPATTTPNIVLINIDSVRADHLGAYGYEKNTSPFLDSLFKTGVLFENAITPAYLTFQTDAAIFSGLYPSQNNVTTWSTPLNADLTLLPHILKTYGYKTAAFVSPSLWPYFGFAKDFDTYKVNGRGKNIEESRVDAAKWIQNNSEPYFLFWHIYDAHTPFIAPSAEFFPTFYNGPLANRDSYWYWTEQSTSSVPVTTHPKGRNGESKHFRYTLTEDDLGYLKAAYDSGIKYVDWQLSLFFDEIKNNPTYENTIFIISAEHGDDLTEHHFTFHRDIYNVNTHVPLAIIYPKGLNPGKVSALVSSLDLMPTILSFAGIPIPANGEGIDLHTLLSGNSTKRYIYTERPPYDEYSVTDGNWKYILRNPDKTFSLPDDLENVVFFKSIRANDITSGDELYRVSVDPYEQKNLAGTGLTIENTLKNLALEFKKKMTNARNSNQHIQQIKAPKPLIPYP